MNPLVSTPALPCMTRAEFAVLLHVSVRTVDRLIADGEIRVRRVRGRAVRILRSEAERYLTAGSATGNGEIKNLKTKNQTGELTPESSRTTKK
jgi:excisionase family DNA binding protein